MGSDGSYSSAVREGMRTASTGSGGSRFLADRPLRRVGGAPDIAVASVQRAGQMMARSEGRTGLVAAARTCPGGGMGSKAVAHGCSGRRMGFRSRCAELFGRENGLRGACGCDSPARGASRSFCTGLSPAENATRKRCTAHPPVQTAGCRRGTRHSPAENRVRSRSYDVDVRRGRLYRRRFGRRLPPPRRASTRSMARPACSISRSRPWTWPMGRSPGRASP